MNTYTPSKKKSIIVVWYKQWHMKLASQYVYLSTKNNVILFIVSRWRCCYGDSSVLRHNKSRLDAARAGGKQIFDPINKNSFSLFVQGSLQTSTRLLHFLHLPDCWTIPPYSSLLLKLMFSRIAPATKRSVQQAFKPTVQVNWTQPINTMDIHTRPMTIVFSTLHYSYSTLFFYRHVSPRLSPTLLKYVV